MALRDIESIECVQRWFTSCIYKQANIFRTENAKPLTKPPSLTTVSFDMAICFKIMNNSVNLPFD